MTVIQAIVLFSFALFSIIDLRTRLVPFIEAFFLIAVYFAFPKNELHITVMVLIVIWGFFRSVPARLALTFLFYPLSWPALLVGFGVRKEMVGRADLFAVAMISFFFPFAAVIAALLGFEVWRRWWMSRGNYGFIPALPGLFIGLSVYSFLQIILSGILSI